MKFFFFLGFIVSCSTEVVPNARPAHRPVKLENIAVYENNPSAHFKFHGKLAGLGCTRSKAIDAAKLKAGILKANSIVNLVCQKAKSDWLSECKSTMKCAGDAVTIK